MSSESVDVPAPQPIRLTRQEYLDERRELYKYQQANYDSFETTLVTLSGSFLVFSISFLAFLKSGREAGLPLMQPGSAKFILGSWILLAVSLSILVVSFFVNARAYTVEILRVEQALGDIRALDAPNPWSTAAMWIYGISTVSFLAGVTSLVWFCRMNFIAP